MFILHMSILHVILTCSRYAFRLYVSIVLSSFLFFVFCFWIFFILKKHSREFPQLCLFHKHSVTLDSAHLTPRAALCGSAALSPLAGILQTDVVVSVAWCHFQLPKKCLHPSDQMLLPLMIPWVPKFVRPVFSLFLYVF